MNPGLLAAAADERLGADTHTSRPAVWRALAYAVSLAFALGWTLSHGKAFHWDAVNYHFYLGFAALNDRFGTDFFAAGTPSYINPFAYVPLYLMDSAALPAVVVAVVLASSHALIFWLTYELGLLVSASRSDGQRSAFAILGVVLATLSPVLLQSLGLTLVDIPIGVLVVAGWLTLAKALRDERLGWVALGGALCGAASALKLSNALFAAAAMSMIAFLPGTWKRRMLAAIVYGAACGAIFVAVSAPWSWKLWQEFGNPVFPFANEWFASPDFTSEPLRYERFRPLSWQAFVTRPFEMLSPLSRMHTEQHSPDLRFAATLVALLGWAGVAAARAIRQGTSKPLGSSGASDARRVLVALAVAVVVAWCLWLKISGNSRYFIPIACIASVVLAGVLQRAHEKWKDATVVVIAVLLLAQTVQIVLASDWQRKGIAWDGPILRREFPERFRNEPHLFLSTSFLSGSAFLPYWHPDSGMMTISGFYALGPGHPGGARAQALIDRNIDRVRILSLLPPGFDDKSNLPGRPSDLSIYVRRFGLEVDESDCAFVKLQSNTQDAAKADGDRMRWSWTTYLTCRLRSAPQAAARYANDVREIDLLFDRVENSCPNLFHPRRPVTEQLPRWVRLYNLGSEQQLWIADGRVMHFSALLGGDPVDIGSVESWKQRAQPIDCSKKSDPAWGGLLR